MPSKVDISKRSEVFNRAIFRIEEANLRHEKYDGTMSDEITRLSLDRGDSVAAVIHHTDTDEIVLVEQFRYSTYGKDTGWIMELPAGMVRDSERPEDSMRSELIEETGYTVLSLHHISTFYASPGGSSERIHLYYARVEASNKTSEGGGAEEENEDIKTIRMPLSQISLMLDTRQFADAKTVIGLQWVLLNKDHLHIF